MCGPVIVSNAGRRPVGGALAPLADHRPGISGWIGSGVCSFTHALSGAWQGRNGDHVSGKRCSGLDLLGCDPARRVTEFSGYVSHRWCASAVRTGSGAPWPDSDSG